MKTCPECNGKKIIYELEYGCSSTPSEVQIPRELCGMCNGVGTVSDDLFVEYCKDDNSFVTLELAKQNMIVRVVTIIIIGAITFFTLYQVI